MSSVGENDSPRPTKQIMRGVAFVVIPLIGLLVAGWILDTIPLAAARPPKHLKTLEEFRGWKRDSIIGEGTYENSGLTYTVLLVPAGRFLASGPSAYLFDEEGQFVDWTADMGDSYTVKNRFNLTSGHVENIELKKPRTQR